MSKYGDAEDIATITKQATDFSVSEIVKQGGLGRYSFMRNGSPKSSGNGTDVVILKIADPADRRHYEETNITINFTIQ